MNSAGEGVERGALARVEAKDYADALQKGCDVGQARVIEGRLGVHTVDATKTAL